MSESNLSDIVFVETKFETFISSSVSQELYLLPKYQEIWFQLQMLENIVHEIQIAASRSPTFPFFVPSFSTSTSPLVFVGFHTPISSTITTRTSLPLTFAFQITVVNSNSSHTTMAARYTPLDLPTPLYDLPLNYKQCLLQFYGIGPLTTQQNVGKLNDFIDLEEVDHEDVKLRLFA